MVGSGEGRQYLEKENIFFPEEKGEQYLKKENIWRGKIFGPRRRRRRMEKEREESFGEGKLMVTPTNGPTNQANIVQSAFSKVRK